jgi:radial spoke head protein 4/6
MPEEPGPICFIQDLLHDNALLAWAGISIGTTEAHLLQKSLKKLATTANATSMRFFGKIAALKSDYYIAEAVVEGGEDEAGEGEEKDP